MLNESNAKMRISRVKFRFARLVSGRDSIRRSPYYRMQAAMTKAARQSLLAAGGGPEDLQSGSSR
jgi:hypothetical protein